MEKISGKNIYLRLLQTSDVSDAYVRWLGDPEVNRYLETRFQPQTHASIMEFVKAKLGSKTELLFAICLAADDRHIGNIKLGPINEHHRSADVSLFIGEKAEWGKGYAGEAISLVTKHAFTRLKLNKLKAGCYGANQGSARAFERCGYVREGLLRGQVFSEGKEDDVILLGLRAADYGRAAAAASHSETAS